jgi:hypothetical protein
VLGKHRPEGYQIQRAGLRSGRACFGEGRGAMGSKGEGLFVPVGSAVFLPSASEPPVMAEDLMKSRLFIMIPFEVA